MFNPNLKMIDRELYCRLESADYSGSPLDYQCVYYQHGFIILKRDEIYYPVLENTSWLIDAIDTAYVITHTHKLMIDHSILYEYENALSQIIGDC